MWCTTDWQKLPPSPMRKRRDDMRIATGGEVGQAASGVQYEPPSPSRPWQLIDVLWQPLPPPSRGYPVSPSSPLKRSRTDEDGQPTPNGKGHGHVRTGSSHHHPQSPVGQVKFGQKRRSQSYSHHRVPSTPSTKQDVDAAKALTEMLGSGSRNSTPTGRDRDSDTRRRSTQLNGHASLPMPPTFERSSPSRPRSSSMAPSPSPKSKRDKKNVDDEDKNAAELMMFLAHSPSPATRTAAEPTRALGSAARVLFAEGSEGVKHDASHSNLALAPPITANINPAGAPARSGSG